MDLNALKIFIKVGETQSFTKAAQALGLTQSGVSRAITRLELDLRVTLLNRNTHSVSLTTDGVFLYESSKSLIHEMDEVGHSITGRTVFPEGELKITTPSAYGRLVIIPMLKEILDRYPALTIDAVMTDRLVDLVEEGFDAAIRIGSVQDSRLIARTIKHLRFVTVASPEYLNSHGIPKEPAELVQHNCLAVKAQRTGRSTKWFYSIAGEQQAFDIKGNLVVDTADVLLEAALSGMGVVQIMDFAVGKYLENGKLVELLQEYSEASIPLSLIYAKSRHRSPKISTLLAALGINT
ncbi:TPA: LysR family transcriptional regulator [Serratia marcescens]|uniref:D-malate degradation protein R n=1 Tax=Raoultella planticola TaxID=575 RepID=A0A485CT24_RAOPL|nr:MULTISPECIES: LysR family transcriptional regulator [Enterobacteriaceae]ELT9604901.1 LysR family transcriptional regulator [Raoultella planticola]HBQ3193993.1 LysR family transcriptional regulator [Klebsiella variicola subsp. variicola]HCI6455271.1 LysR family transcriptional regulator [Klebsiella quasipneumoniae subsp. similipneumoniae]HCQ8415936.1 LysR family transcriptional regulator [Klebsiella michiganensis]HDT4281603.1 LysR family transcriptional regulator [Klebsiella pneumoniae subsp